MEVFEITIPLSKPAWLVTYGHRRLVAQLLIVNRSMSVESSMNRGCRSALVAVMMADSGA